MSLTIIGTVDNGGTALADFPFYKGTVGIRSRAGAETIEVAFRGTGRSPRLPVSGILDGEPVEVLSLETSNFDRQLMLAVVRPAPLGDTSA